MSGPRKNGPWEERSSCESVHVGRANTMVAPSLLRLAPKECPAAWIGPLHDRHPANWNNLNCPVVPLERHLHGHPLAGLRCERKLGKS